MPTKPTTSPFEATFEDIQADPDAYVDAVFESLGSAFLVLPRGPGFIDYSTFERGYEALKLATEGFAHIEADRVWPVVSTLPISVVVLRSILGFSPPEWAYVTKQRTGVQIDQGDARALDRKARMSPETALLLKGAALGRIRALVESACAMLNEGAPRVDEDRIHRLDKADTATGPTAIRRLSSMGVPYAMLLYERFLGRPFAGHRDSVSEIVGDVVESAVEDQLTKAGVSFRKTKRAERIDGFDQAPDFIIPSEFSPRVIIEAKLTEDDGTARDKVTRIQHLCELSVAGMAGGAQKFEVVACIAGRGFGVRREDMKKMLLATRGKVFTLGTMGRLVACTRIREFATARPDGTV
jgi:hypothetical protein